MWKYARYMQQGISHRKRNVPCQDNVWIEEDNDCIVAALADGLGSLKNSEVASQVATEAVCKTLLSKNNDLLKLEMVEQKAALSREIVICAQEAVRKAAQDAAMNMAELDCTLVFVYISKKYNYAITGRLGDSAVCVVSHKKSIAINDGANSANATYSLCDENAMDHLDLKCWDIEQDEIEGFILTSDGLDGAIYTKGSPAVDKEAERFFNAVLSVQPEDKLKEFVGELTTPDGSPFDDDISLVVISRASKPFVFPSNPTWLCSCGTRNRLQSTVCSNCGTDFASLYGNHRADMMREGGKYNYFSMLNKHPEKEQMILDHEINPTPVVKPIPDGSKSTPKPHRESEKSEKKHRMDWFRKWGLLLIAVSVVLGYSLGRATAPKEVITPALKKPDNGEIQEETKADPGEAVDEEKETSFILLAENGEQSDTVSSDEPEEKRAEQEYHHWLDDNTEYWGNLEKQVPSGYGVLLESDYYYVGFFNDGKKNGPFAIISLDGEVSLAEYNDNARILIDSRPNCTATVKTGLLGVLDEPDSLHEPLDTLQLNDVVEIIDQEKRNGKLWTKIKFKDNNIGWVDTDCLDFCNQ